MEWELIVALVISIPIVLFPVALIWFINFGGISHAIKEVLRGEVAGLPGGVVRSR